MGGGTIYVKKSILRVSNYAYCSSSCCGGGNDVSRICALVYGKGHIIIFGIQCKKQHIPILGEMGRRKRLEQYQYDASKKVTSGGVHGLQVHKIHTPHTQFLYKKSEKNR